MSEEDASPGIQIGDRLLITGGNLDGTRGRLYGMYPDHLAILPDGVTDRIIRIPLIDGSPDPELEIEAFDILESATRPGFLQLSGMRAGDMIQTFGEDGTAKGVFSVKSLDLEEDSAIFLTETGEEVPIVFGFSGIPQGEFDFEVLRAREAPALSGAERSRAERSGAPGQSGTDKSAEVKVEESPIEVTVENEGEGVSMVVNTAPEDEDEDADANTEEDDEFPFEIIEQVTIPVEVRLKKKDSADRIILDVFQKSDLLTQLIQTLSPEDQKDPIQLQAVRRRMEVLMFLQKKVVNYGITGEPQGLRNTSVETMSEYVKYTKIPMTRKVVTATKVFYAKNGVDVEEDDIRVEDDYALAPRAAALQKEMDVEGGVKVGLPTFYSNMEKYRAILQSPYILQPSNKTVTVDEEAFRNEMPTFDSEPTVTARGRWGSDTQPPVVQVPYSMLRLLKPRTVQLQDAMRIIEAGDSASTTNTLIFPRSAGRDLGPIRSGRLSRDISYGMKSPNATYDLLSQLGTPTEFPTAKDILSIGPEGSVPGGIRLETWLDMQNYHLFGPGDIYEELVGYSLDKIEFTKEQQEVLSFKIKQGIAALRLYITKKREESRTSLANLRFTRNDLLPVERNGRLHTRVLNEPSLQDLMKGFEQQVGPDVAQVDSAWFTYLYMKYPDFLLAVLGESAPVVTKFRHIHVRNSILKVIQNAYLDSVTERFRGDPPMENKCTHVKALYAIEKADDDVDKMKKYIALLGEYRGPAVDSWIDCRKCKQHLICMHELLQIQEYMRPKEKDILHKELLLNYSGGQFSGKYMCKGCGKFIGDLEFDTTLEFDDQGHPLMGRAVMEEEVDTEGISDVLEAIKEDEEEAGMNEAEKRHMRVLKNITERLGIHPDVADFRAMVEQVGQYLLTLIPKEEYAELLRAKRVRQDYDIYYNIRYVAAATAVLLLNIQCHIPDYTIYYSRAECKDGFLGFPISGDESMVGVQCLCSIVAGIQDKEAPWNMTSLQKVADIAKRREVFQPIVVKLLEEYVETKPTVQAAIKRKREYMKKTFGTVTGAKVDTFASSFRPEPYVAKEEAAKAPIVEGATPLFQATAWIRQAHDIVKGNTNLRDGSILSQTTSCLHSILRPNEFWEGTSMPPLPPKQFEGRLARTKTLTLKNIYKPKEKVVGKVEDQNMYKLFLDLCHDGARKGLPHELGLGLTCLRCGLKFEENPNLPVISDIPTSAKAEVQEEGKRVAAEKARAQQKGALEQQGIDVSPDAFNDLLFTSHRLAKMETPRPKRVEIDTMQSVAGMVNPPFEDWGDMLLAANKALGEIGDSYTEIQIVKAAEPFVTRVLEMEDEIAKRMGPAVRDALLSMAGGSVAQCTEYVRTYLIVPFQRWLQGIDGNSYSILKSYGLDPVAQAEIMVKGMGAHLEGLSEDMPTGILRSKVEQMVAGLSNACRNVFPKIRPIFLRGGATMARYIVRGCLMGFVSTYINPNIVSAEEDTAGTPFTIEKAYKSLGKAMYKYSTGSRVPSEEEIRMRLEERIEKEKQLFIGSIGGMTAERRKVELMNKQLGIGKWAVQDKDIRKYNPERFLVEQQERLDSGVVEEMALDSGYDHDQQAEDDY
uniref:Uncharacterized protein n=1 Tax=viral metagenome TaxID=1070528 RepID=A0A6C0L9R4_9ZZZZ